MNTTDPYKVLKLALGLLEESSPDTFSLDVIAYNLNFGNIFHIKTDPTRKMFLMREYLITGGEYEPFQNKKVLLDLFKMVDITMIRLIYHNSNGKLQKTTIYKCNELDGDYCFKNYRTDKLQQVRDTLATMKLQQKFRSYISNKYSPPDEYGKGGGEGYWLAKENFLKNNQ